MTKEILTKLLKSTNSEDNLLGLEFQYQAFKKNYTNWYKREKYNREFRKRIFSLYYPNTPILVERDLLMSLGNISVHSWFKARLEEDFKDNML